MSREEVTVEIDRVPPNYRPGESVSGAWVLADHFNRTACAAELSVLWHTDGKGDEDLGVQHFERLSADEAAALPSTTPVQGGPAPMPPAGPTGQPAAPRVVGSGQTPGAAAGASARAAMRAHSHPAVSVPITCRNSDAPASASRALARRNHFAACRAAEAACSRPGEA